MPFDPDREEALFHAASEISEPAMRRAYLERECGDATAVVERILRLLDLAGDPAGFFGPEPEALEAATPARVGEGPGDVIGPYRLVERLGEGGFAVVFLAEQQQPIHRIVALKILKPGMDSRQVLARFEGERRILELMDHPHVARVLDAGATECGRPYFVMERVDGVPITEFCDRNRVDLRQRLEIFIRVCQAVQHAHQKGVIHRDLKPSNVLIARSEPGGELVPKVIDFGIAKAIDPGWSDRSYVTAEGQFLGTPAYISPEQAERGALDIDTRADVYSLGAMLCELLTGTPPFPENRLRASGFTEFLRILREEEPERPSLRLERTQDSDEARRVADARATDPAALARRVAGDLDWIVLKALEKDRTRRYETVNGVAVDLRRHLGDEPVSARPPTLMYQLGKLARRNRVKVAAIGAVVAAIVLGGTLALWQAVRATRAREHAEDSLQRLQVRRAREFLESDRVSDGLAILARLVRENPDREEMSSWLINELSLRNFPRPLLKPIEHPDTVHDARFSPDGKWILTVCRDNAARLFASGTGQPIGSPLRHDSNAVRGTEYRGGLPALRAEFSPDGQRVATASCDRTARIWEVASGQPLTPPLEHTDYVSFARFSPDGSNLATGCKDGVVRFWRVATGEATGISLRHGAWVNSAEFSPDGRWLLTSSDDFTARLWDVETGRALPAEVRDKETVQHACFHPDGTRILTVGPADWGLLFALDGGSEVRQIGRLVHSDNVPYGTFSPDGRWVATASFDHTAGVWSSGEAAPISVLRHGGTVRLAEFSPDSLRLLTASEDGTARIWDAESGRAVTEPMRHRGEVWSARFDRVGTRVVTASADRTVQVWDVRSGQGLPLRLAHDNRAVREVAWSPNGRLVATAGNGATLWDATTGDRHRYNDLWYKAGIRRVRFHPAGDRVLVGREDGTAQIWPADGAQRPLVQVRHPDAVQSIDFDAAGGRFLSVSSGGGVQVADTETGQLLFPTVGKAERLVSAAFSPVDGVLAAGSEDGRVLVWEVATGDRLRSWTAHAGQVQVLRFSGDGRWLITGSSDRTARVWSLATGTPAGPPLRHLGSVTDAELSRDGQRAVTASRDQTALVWDVRSGGVICPPLRHKGAVTAVHFDPTERRVLTASEDRTVRVWSLPSGRPLGPPLEHDQRVRDARFSPDGQAILAGADGMAVIWRIWNHPEIAPEWLPGLAEAVAQQRLASEEVAENIAPAPLGLPDPPGVEAGRSGEAEAWRRWFLGDRVERPHTFEARISGRELVVRYLRESRTFKKGDRHSFVKEALALDPAYGPAYAEWLRVLIAEGVTDGGQGPLVLKALAREAIARAPESGLALWAQALHFEAMGRRPEARAAVLRAAELEPVEPMLCFAAAHFLLQDGRTQEARAWLGKAVDLAEQETDRRRRWDMQGAMAMWAIDQAVRGVFPEADEFKLLTCGIPTRPGSATPGHFDLTACFNGSLHFPAEKSGGDDYDLSDLPQGIVPLGGVAFDVRGVAWLRSAAKARLFGAVGVPERYLVASCGTGILAGLRVAAPRTLQVPVTPGPWNRLHFLLGAEDEEVDGTPIALIRVRDVNGGEAELPIRYGRDLRTWVAPADPRDLPEPAWRHVTHLDEVLRLYVVSWDNPRPAVEIERVDLVSTMSRSQLFILAITGE